MHKRPDRHYNMLTVHAVLCEQERLLDDSGHTLNKRMHSGRS